MKILYNCTVAPVYAETEVVPSLVPSESDFYLERLEEFLTFDVKILKENISKDSQARIYSTKKNSTGYRLKVNTTNIKGTNILNTDGIPYFYKVVSSKTFEDSSLNFLDVIKVEGIFYSNVELKNREIEPGIFVSTELVLDLRTTSDVITHKFKAREIEIDFKTNVEYVFDTIGTTSFTPQLINDNTVYFPSFILDNRSYVEGDLKEVHKEEYVLNNGNLVKPKQKMIQNLTESTIGNTTQNYIVLPYSDLQSSLVKIKYLAKYSSHQFTLNNDVSYFKFTPYMIEVSNKEDADISVELVLDMDKVNIIPNKFKHEYQTENLFYQYITCKSQPSIEEALAFKKYIPIELSFFPSSSCYIKQDTSVYYTHQNLMKLDPRISEVTTRTTPLNFTTDIKDRFVTFTKPTITYFKR